MHRNTFFCTICARSRDRAARSRVLAHHKVEMVSGRLIMEGKRTSCRLLLRNRDKLDPQVSTPSRPSSYRRSRPTHRSVLVLSRQVSSTDNLAKKRKGSDDARFSLSPSVRLPLISLCDGQLLCKGRPRGATFAAKGIKAKRGRGEGSAGRTRLQTGGKAVLGLDSTPAAKWHRPRHAAASRGPREP